MQNKGPLFTLCFLFGFMIVAMASSQLVEFPVDIGNNLSIPCPIRQDVMWVREGIRENRQKSKMIILDNGSLFLPNVDRNDSGIYSCSKANTVDFDDKYQRRVFVRTPPPALANVIVRPSTIIALIIWEVNGTGGYPIINFTAQYRLAGSDEEWLPISPNHITPNSRQIDVYKLQPNTTYEFRIWATNRLGQGEVTVVTGTTSHTYQEQELARHMLAGADTFDTRAWAVAVGVVMGTLVLLGMGTCYLLYRECRTTDVVEEQEIIELVPNIILNPGFDANLPADENSNSETYLRLNNNTVVQPTND